MPIYEYPRLCGATFFTLVLQALPQRMNAREHYDGDSDGLSDPEVLVGLLKVVNPDYKDPGKEKLKTIVNNYKQGGNSNSAYFPFHDDQTISAFDETVRTEYKAALNGMIGFVNDFIDLGERVHKDANLVRALVDLILQDRSVKDGEEFYIGPNGEKKKKAAFGDLKDVCLPSFLLGVWHYVLVNRKDNNVGRETYNAWCPSTGGGHRTYTADMGNGILPDLRVYTVDTEEEPEEVILDAEPERADGEYDDAGTNVPPQGGAQFYQNPLIIQQNGDGNMVIPNYGTINITKK